jgi:hypothetical protein
MTDPDLLSVANRRLIELRAQLASSAGRDGQGEARTPAAGGGQRQTAPGGRGWEMENAQRLLAEHRRRVGLQPAERRSEGPALFEPVAPAEDEAKPAAAQAAGEGPGVRSYPDLSLAALSAGEASTYRVWLLARHLRGDGWVDVGELKDALTAPGSPLRTFTSRQRVGQLIAQGERIGYWRLERGGRRLRYLGAAALARRLGVDRLSGRPVYLPLSAVTGGTAALKAGLYASFHAGRTEEGGEGRPISRDVLQAVTGQSRTTLWRYERAAGVAKRRNIVVTRPHSRAAAEEAAWRHGQAAFAFYDATGQHGRPGRFYLARTLPNSYRSALEQAPRGRLRKTNRSLKSCHPCGLWARGAGRRFERLFHSDGGAAGKAFDRDPERPAFWPLGRARSGSGLWAAIPAA